jgi:hypothetical protein
MRALILALAIAAAAGTASAAGPGTGNPGGEVPESITPTAPAGARKQAEDAVKHDVGDAGLKFRGVKTSLVESLRRGGMFAEPIEGPLALVCGQYQKPGQADYSWFFVAIKHGKVQWTSDQTSSTPDEAHDSCKAAGLAS